MLQTANEVITNRLKYDDKTLRHEYIQFFINMTVNAISTNFT